MDNVPRMRKTFLRMVNIPVRGMTEEENEAEEKTKQNSGLTINHQQGRGGGGQEETSFYEPDTLQQELRRRKRAADRYEDT